MQRCFYHEGLVGGNGFLGGVGPVRVWSGFLRCFFPPSSAMPRRKAFANNNVRESHLRNCWGIDDHFGDSMGSQVIPFIRCRYSNALQRWLSCQPVPLSDFRDADRPAHDAQFYATRTGTTASSRHARRTHGFTTRCCASPNEKRHPMQKVEQVVKHRCTRRQGREYVALMRVHRTKRVKISPQSCCIYT